MCWDSDLDLQGHLVEDLENEVLHRLPAQAVQAAAEPGHGQAADAIDGEAGLRNIPVLENRQVHCTLYTEHY